MTQQPGDRTVLKHLGQHQWAGIDRQQYKADGDHWKGVSRTEIVAEPNRPELPFHLRYFEIEPGGFSSREKHAHEHVVIVTHGRGTVLFDETSKELAAGDVVHVRSWQVHQFRCAEGNEPLGFYCIVAADRDRPIIEGGGASSCELPSRAEPLDVRPDDAVQ